MLLCDIMYSYDFIYTFIEVLNLYGQNEYRCFSDYTKCKIITHKWLKVTATITKISLYRLVIRQQQLNQDDVPFPI